MVTQKGKSPEPRAQSAGTMAFVGVGEGWFSLDGLGWVMLFVDGHHLPVRHVVVGR